jgi:hypothetical protein
MGSNNVVSIRVEALGVSITIVDGSIAIEQAKTEIPAVSAVVKGVDGSTVRRDSGAETPVIDELEQTSGRPSPLSRNGPTGLPGEAKPVPASPRSPVRAGAHFGKGQEHRSSQNETAMEQ